MSDTPSDSARPLLFTPITIRGVTAKNRIVVSPMCQYHSVDGGPTDWQLMHIGRLAAGGSGIVFGEETAVEDRGRKTYDCAGIWADKHIPMYRRITDFIREQNAVPAIQLGHSGPQGVRPQRGARLGAAGPGGRRRRAGALAGRFVKPAAGCAGKAHTEGNGPRRYPDGARRLARGRAPVRGRGLRVPGDPRRTRLPDPPVPVAFQQPADGRLWRRPAGPHALRARGRGGRARRPGRTSRCPGARPASTGRAGAGSSRTRSSWPGR